MSVINGLHVGGTYKFSDLLKNKKTKKKKLKKKKSKTLKHKKCKKHKKTLCVKCKPNNIMMKIDGVLMIKKRNKWRRLNSSVK